MKVTIPSAKSTENKVLPAEEWWEEGKIKKEEKDDDDDDNFLLAKSGPPCPVRGVLFWSETYYELADWLPEWWGPIGGAPWRHRRGLWTKSAQG